MKPLPTFKKFMKIYSLMFPMVTDLRIEMFRIFECIVKKKKLTRGAAKRFYKSGGEEIA